MRRAALLPALAVAAAAPFLSGCGAGGLDPVAKAADKAASAGSEHARFSGFVVAGGQTVRLAGSGDFQQQPRRGRASFSISGGPVNASLDEVIDGTSLYLRSPLFARLLPQGKTWVTVDLQKIGSKLGVDVGQLAQTSPTDVLPALRKAGSVKKLGTATIDGVQTTHYQAVVDPKKLPGGSALKSVQVSPFPIDAWIGTSDGLLRRLTLSETASAGGQSAATRWTMDFSNYGERVDVTAPPASETLDLTGAAAGP
jgi:hypothetical protein